jgi:hypothetical protein
VWRITNPSRASFAFAGYSPSQRQIVFSFRGTNGLDYANWCSNLDAVTSFYPFGSNANAHSGFYNAYKAIGYLITDVAQKLRT